MKTREQFVWRKKCCEMVAKSATFRKENGNTDLLKEAHMMRVTYIGRSLELFQPATRWKQGVCGEREAIVTAFSGRVLVTPKFNF